MPSKKEKKTQFPVSNGSLVYYLDKDGNEGSGIAVKILWAASDDTLSFLIVKNKDDSQDGGVWIREEDFI